MKKFKEIWMSFKVILFLVCTIIAGLNTVFRIINGNTWKNDLICTVILLVIFLYYAKKKSNSMKFLFFGEKRLGEYDDSIVDDEYETEDDYEPIE